MSNLAYALIGATQCVSRQQTADAYLFVVQDRALMTGFYLSTFALSLCSSIGLLAVLGKLFIELAEHRDEAERQAAEAGGSAWDRLLARSLAYVRFGLERPGHYKVLYEGRAIPRLDDPRVAALGQPMLDRTAELIGDILRRSRAKHAVDAQRLALLLWAGLHGIVSLQINKPTMQWPEADELVEQMT